MELYGKLSDANLLSLLKAGDRWAFTEIYNRYWAVLYLHARRMLHNRDSARDIVHEVFTGIWSKSADLELSGSLNAYLYKSVRNTIINLIRKEKHESVYIDKLGEFYDKGNFATDEMVNFNDLKFQIEKEIALLPKKMRMVFELSRNENLTHAEIAKQLKISDLTVKKHINKAIHILRKRLDIPATIIILYLHIR
ncbi:RNA polymerase sigma-70 factor [Pedobacter agri]|uniref:RNA polymerase sigma factor n=1 Tax=Pedobacter agri TaxID=454586 RepID=UPI00292CF1E6|nr:RNA polymerase sigma-70 factor [Pedobacter agri]